MAIGALAARAASAGRSTGPRSGRVPSTMRPPGVRTWTKPSSDSESRPPRGERARPRPAGPTSAATSSARELIAWLIVSLRSARWRT